MEIRTSCEVGAHACIVLDCCSSFCFLLVFTFWNITSVLIIMRLSHVAAGLSD